MPEMSGPSLGDALKKIWPGIRVMFMLREATSWC